jgi:hypothetical protein
MSRPIVLVVLLCMVLSPETARASDSAQHQAAVERRSEQVMPFDMNRSVHVFRSTASGGVQRVVSLDGDPGQVALIRAHLKEISSAFGRGDFRNPVHIHGASAPGLPELRQNWRHLHVSYASVRNGATITYESTDPRVVGAVHTFFGMQVRDHGKHAKMDPGMKM